MDPEQINEEISDEALEAAGNADQLAIFSLGNCTDARLCQMPNGWISAGLTLESARGYGQMSKSSEYQKLANDCLDMAERASPADREILHQMAEVWLKLATAELNKISAQGQDEPSND